MPTKLEYIERKAEMSRLRFTEGWTIEAIGEHFGVTRERVRQILGNSGHLSPKFRTKQIQSFDNLHLTNTELSEKYGISVIRIRQLRSGLNYAADPEEGKRWQKSTKWLATLLTEWSVKYTLLYDHRFRLSGGQTLWPVVGKLKQYRTHLSPHPFVRICLNKRLLNSDFLLGVIEDTGTVYIIPTDKLETSSGVNLQEEYGGSGKGRSSSKYERYREAWYLLDLV